MEMGLIEEVSQVSHVGFRGLFCLVVGISAATVADPLLEGASNAGWFGPGNYTDHSTLDVLPALATATASALLYVVLSARPLLAPGRHRLRSWLRDSLRTGAAKTSLAESR
jgi:hypothetical protein